MSLPLTPFCWPVTRQPQRLEIAWGPLEDRQLSVGRIRKRGCRGHLEPKAQACQFWPQAAVGSGTLPPTVTLGQDLQQGRHDRDWIGSFCCRFWLLQILKPSQRHLIHLPNACAPRRRGTRAELHLNCKRPQLFPGEHPVARPKRSPSGSSLHCAVAVGRRCDDTTGTAHCFINFMPRARPAGKDSIRTISHAQK